VNSKEYDIKDILDKKDFAVSLGEKKTFSIISFIEQTEVLDKNFQKTINNLTSPQDNVLDITSELPKGVIQIPDNHFHYFSDFIGPIYVFLDECIKNNIEEIELITFALETSLRVVKDFHPFLKHCLDEFSNDIKVYHKEIFQDLENGYDFVKINNHMTIDQQDIGVSLDFIYEKSKTFSNSLSQNKPTRKIFISRKVDNPEQDLDERHLHQKDVEDFFISNGYEVIRGEDFENLKQQMAFFNDVGVFIGFTGSGLTNSLFMQPEQVLVEIVCPLRFSDTEKYEIHNFYKTISVLKRHTYVAVSNINVGKDALIKNLSDVLRML
jgi:hypothetical protein